MKEFVRPIPDYTIYIYIILAFVALFFVYRIWVARRNQSRSLFTVERELANTAMTNSLIGLLVTIGIGIGIIYLNNVIPIYVPPLPETPTATPIIELPDTPTPPILISTPTTTPTPTATATPAIFGDDLATFTPEPGQPAPAVSPGQSPNCPISGNRINRPGNGATVNGLVAIAGTANIEGFDYYKFEFRIPGGDWSYIERYNTPVTNGILGAWDSTNVPSGQYELRLVVVDNTGNFPEPCTVRLTVQ